MEDSISSSSVEEQETGEPKIQLKSRAGLSTFHQYVTVQPCLFLYSLAISSMNPLTDQYVLHTIHKENNFTKDIVNESGCVKNLSDPDYIKEQDLQAQASNLAMIFSVTSILPSLIFTTQLGGHSNVAGRKLPLICVTAGVFVRCLFSILIVHFELPLQLFNVACIFEGIGGNQGAFLMACFAYIADITSYQKRAMHIFLLEMYMAIGLIVSSIATGYFIEKLGYMFPYLLICGLHGINLIYIVFILKESIERDRNQSFFTLDYYKQQWRLYRYDNGKNRRWKLQLALLIFFIVCIPQIGGNAALIYFQLDSPICFTSVDLGWYSAIRYVGMGLSGYVVIKLFMRRIGDVGLIVVSGITAMLFFTWVAFTKSKVFMYLFSVCSSLTIPMVRSFCSKLTDPNEQGAMFSAVANVQMVAIPLGTVILNSIYSATIKPPYFKGTTFLVQAAFTFITLVLAAVLFIIMKKEKKDEGVAKLIPTVS